MSPHFFLQQCLIGLTNGALIALVALGYTMVYGIIGLINFAHGDLIMLGACLALSLVGALGMTAAGPATTWVGIAGLVLVCGLFCGLLNVAVDRIVYKPLRHAPKLAPLVSAIGVSFIFMNIGLFWLGPADKSFPELLPSTNLLGGDRLQFTWKDLLVVLIVGPLMVALSVLVKGTKLGKAMRAVSQDPPAAALVFACHLRGSRLFGSGEHDAALISRRLRGIPAAGFHCAGEVAPIGPRSYLNSQTTAIALFRAGRHRTAVV